MIHNQCHINLLFLRMIASFLHTLWGITQHWFLISINTSTGLPVGMESLVIFNNFFINCAESVVLLSLSHSYKFYNTSYFTLFVTLRVLVFLVTDFNTLISDVLIKCSILLVSAQYIREKTVASFVLNFSSVLKTFACPS